MANSRFKQFNDFLAMMGSAIAASSATRNHRTPRAADLKRLGIDPEQFGKISRW